MKKILIILVIVITGCQSNSVNMKPMRLVEKKNPPKVVVDEGRLIFEILGTNFKINKTQITVEIAKKIKVLAEQIKGKKGILKVIGSSCSTGSEKYNLKISKERADNVASILKNELKTEKILIVSEGKGEKNPEYSNETLEGRYKNRNIKIYFVEDSGSKKIKYVNKIEDLI
ncbi:MAG: OmpA family protein [Psychrilyobacter sp.]|uniref:OmpA family protein n=1 Tax=Psychrilyobacter sp. TaxID=2586924 RepID=UPI003C733911